MNRLEDIGRFVAERGCHFNLRRVLSGRSDRDYYAARWTCSFDPREFPGASDCPYGEGGTAEEAIERAFLMLNGKASVDDSTSGQQPSQKQATASHDVSK